MDKATLPVMAGLLYLVKKCQMRKKRKIWQAGFTLAEIAIVVIAVGIISSVGFVNYSTMIEKFRAKEGEQILIALFGAEKRYAQEHTGGIFW